MPSSLLALVTPYADGLEPWPVLYSFRRCPYAMRARLAIAASGLRCELREVVLRDKPPELLAASPKGTVPVLVLAGGGVIDQSLDIMRWALGHNDPGAWLAPVNGSPAFQQALIAANDGLFKHHLDRYKYPHRYPDEHCSQLAGFAHVHRDAAAGWLKALEPTLARHGWLSGPAATLADMAILPFVRQFAGTDPAWFDAAPWPGLKAWLAHWETGPLYQHIMQKFPPWQAGEPGVLFRAVT